MRFEAHSVLALDASPFGTSLDLIPSINVIRSANPTAHIAVAASAGICELLTSLRMIDKAISFGAIKPSQRGFGSGLLRLISLSRSVGGDELDLVLDFSPSVSTLLYGLTRRARIITPVASRQRMVGAPPFGRNRRRPAAADRYESVLSQLDLSSDISSWAHLPMPEESARFEGSLARSGYKGGEPILLLYTMQTGWPRSWPTPNYAELALRLSSNYGVRVVAADVPYSADFTSRIAFLLPRDAIKLRSPRAAELVAAVARSSLVVTDDSGIARMAARQGSPVIDIGTPPATAGSGPSASANRDFEAVYQEACHLLQTSRTGALFRE